MLNANSEVADWWSVQLVSFWHLNCSIVLVLYYSKSVLRSDLFASDIYYLSFPNDPLIIQGSGVLWEGTSSITYHLLVCSVYTVFVIDIFQSVVVAVTGWHSLCSGWGHQSALTFPGWTFSALPCVSGIGKQVPLCADVSNLSMSLFLQVAAWVQIFFAWQASEPALLSPFSYYLLLR